MLPHPSVYGTVQCQITSQGYSGTIRAHCQVSAPVPAVCASMPVPGIPFVPPGNINPEISVSPGSSSSLRVDLMIALPTPAEGATEAVPISLSPLSGGLAVQVNVQLTVVPRPSLSCGTPLRSETGGLVAVTASCQIATRDPAPVSVKIAGLDLPNAQPAVPICLPAGGSACLTPATVTPVGDVATVQFQTWLLFPPGVAHQGHWQFRAELVQGAISVDQPVIVDLP